MIACDSADARTALLASYFLQSPYPRAGAKAKASSYTPLQQRSINVPDNTREGSDRLATRGRTIYNATSPIKEEVGMTALQKLERIDAEERRRRKEEREQFTSLAYSSHCSTEGSDMDDQTVQEMFDLYIKAEAFA
ncbi:hypothetical protein V8B97DRAFT_613444 [Scleroderma yunnanense]